MPWSEQFASLSSCVGVSLRAGVDAGRCRWHASGSIRIADAWLRNRFLYGAAGLTLSKLRQPDIQPSDADGVAAVRRIFGFILVLHSMRKRITKKSRAPEAPQKRRFFHVFCFEGFQIILRSILECSKLNLLSSEALSFLM